MGFPGFWQAKSQHASDACWEEDTAVSITPGWRSADELLPDHRLGWQRYKLPGTSQWLPVPAAWQWNMLKSDGQCGFSFWRAFGAGYIPKQYSSKYLQHRQILLGIKFLLLFTYQYLVVALVKWLLKTI